MSGEKTYNGFANYETWVVALWLSNERVSYEYFNNLAVIISSHERAGKVGCRKHALAKTIQGEFEERSPVRNHTTVYADLMNAALAEVDWMEIANNILDGITGGKTK